MRRVVATLLAGFTGTDFLSREVAAGETAFERMLDFADAALRGRRSG